MSSKSTRAAVVGAGACALALAAGRALATAYPDTVGDQFDVFTHLDITSVEVTNDATNLSFKINLAGDIVATNWGKYLIGVDSIAGGNTTGNGWGRPIAMSTGMDFFVGSWVDFGNGFEIYHDNAGAWVRDHATYDAVNPLAPPVVTPNSLTLTFPLSYLNLTDGSAFSFDVYSAGGGGTDSANDASSNPNQSITGWPGPYDSGNLLSVYTVDIPTPAGSTWNVNSSGNWGDGGNWSPAGAPNGAGVAVTFGGVPGAAVTVTADLAVTAGALTFDNANGYTIDGSNTITLDATSGPAAVNVVTGSHSITAPLALADATTMTIVPAGSTLTLSNLQSSSSPLTKAGAGTLVLNNARAGNLAVDAGTLRVNSSSGAIGSVSKVAQVSVAAGAKLDLTDNKLVTATPLGTWGGSAYTDVSGLVDAGRGNASNAQWDGSGIVTSDTRAVNNNDLVSIGTAKAGAIKGIADTATTTFAGQTVLGSDSIAMVTWGGDANLDGKINIDDYGQIDFNVGSSGSVFGWYNGDFNYDGKINIDDYGIIDFNVTAQNLIFPTGEGLEGGAAAVPEPTIASSVLALGSVAMARRSRRRSAR